jgi:pyruvate/2-oxoacid:ferredoxin oxidoreductase beta subunit
MKPSEAFALDSWLSYYPAQATYDKIIDAMTDREQAHKAEHIDVWELVEDHDYPYIAQLIEDTRIHFEQTARHAIAKAGYKEALQDLLNYTGGWDITDKEHPIYKARMVLEKEPTI